ncbi:MAG: InlB B-repeat-containing protein [Oscillospiraceae bacterium]|nr:InlB B-repeat-containing protein [Oscillospiraceae bacterium]
MKKRLLAIFMSVALLLSVALPMMSVAAAPGGYPTPVTGRVLTTALSGDTSNWIEIARYGDYSLIVRANYINQQIYRFNEPQWQTPNYGSTNAYMNSIPRNAINNWFNSLTPNPVKVGIDILPDFLPANARLRNFTMQHNAVGNLGTRYTATTQYDGISYPTSYQVGAGLDIAFALSYSEAANYLSITRMWKGITTADYYSPSQAAANFRQLNIPTLAGWRFGMWLRSPGQVASTASALQWDGYVHEFNTLQMPNGASYGYGLAYPALWVNSRVFEPDVVTYNVTYYPNGGTGSVNSFPANANTNHLILDQGYTRPMYEFVGWNTAADGSGTTYQNFQAITVTGPVSLYAQWRRESSIVYHANGGDGADYIDYGNNGSFTIRSNMFTYPRYSFRQWNTSPDGTGAILPAGLSFSNFNGTLHLYAIWQRVD